MTLALQSQSPVFEVSRHQENKREKLKKADSKENEVYRKENEMCRKKKKLQNPSVLSAVWVYLKLRLSLAFYL